MPDTPTPASTLPDDGATARRGPAGRHLAPRGVAAIALAVAATTGVSGCGNDSTAEASTSTIAPSDMSRIAAGNTPRSSSTDPSTALRSAASSAPATSRSASVASSAPGTTSKAGAAAVVIPDAAKAHTKDGAKAFVKFYWETLDTLAAKPQPDALRSLTLPECGTCQLQVSGLTDLLREGAHIETNQRRLDHWAVRADSLDDSVVVTFNQSDRGNVKVAADGSRKRFAPNQLHVAARADWTAGGWRIGAAGADKS